MGSHLFWIAQEFEVRFYYFNEKTGESRWSIPELDQDTGEMANGETPKDIKATAEECVALIHANNLRRSCNSLQRRRNEYAKQYVARLQHFAVGTKWAHNQYAAQRQQLTAISK